MLSRVATYSVSSTLLEASTSLQARMADLEVQSSSGLISSTYSGMDSETTTRVLNLQSSYSDSLSLSDSLSIAGDRIDTMYSALDDMIDELTSLQTALSAASSESDDADTLVETAEGMLEDFQTLLNTQYDGRYLFGGTATTTAPCGDLTELDEQVIPSTEDTSYYNGTDDLISVSLSDDQEMEYGCTADDESIEMAIRAANIAYYLDTDDLDSDALDEAYDLASDAIDGLTSIQASLSVSASRVETAEYREEDLQTTLENSLSDLTQCDVAEVATELQTYETQLSASYSALSTMLSTNLLDYL